MTEKERPEETPEETPFEQAICPLEDRMTDEEANALFSTEEFQQALADFAIEGNGEGGFVCWDLVLDALDAGGPVPDEQGHWVLPAT